MSEGKFLKGDLSRREAMKTALKAGAYAAPVMISAAVPIGVSAATPPPACTRPFTRELATVGTGSGGTVQSATNCGAGFVQSFQVSLVGATPNTSYDVYLDQNSIGSAASHIFAGTFTTDASGNAVFSSKITVPVAATQLDNEIVLHDPTHSNFTQHQFVQDTFPLTGSCIVPCSALASGTTITSPVTGSGSAADAPHK